MSDHMLLGVDLGGTSLRMLAELPDGTRTAISRQPAPASYDVLLDTLVRYQRELDHDGDTAARLGAAGIGVPGTADGAAAGFVPALPWLAGRPLGPDLAARLGCPVFVANDAALCLLAETRLGAARDTRSAVLVTVGTGIGGAVMVNGRLWRGARGSAGSWGWLGATEARADPTHGPFEQVASGTALRDLADDVGPEVLVEHARNGDGRARRVLEVYARRLGRGVAALCSILDPDVLIVAGGVSDALDVLGEPMDEERRRWSSPDGRTVPVIAAGCGSDAGVLGALEAARSGGEVWWI